MSHEESRPGQITCVSIGSISVGVLSRAIVHSDTVHQHARDSSTSVDILSDNELLRQISLGNRQALITLYLTHRQQALDVAFRIVADSRIADEAVKQAFLAVWRTAKSFDLAQDSVIAWLLTQVHYYALMPCAQPLRSSLPAGNAP